MTKRRYTSHKTSFTDRGSQQRVENTHKKKIVSRRYNITSQTAYHITDLALREDMTEGQILDKLMRGYLATQRCKI